MKQTAAGVEIQHIGLVLVLCLAPMVINFVGLEFSQTPTIPIDLQPEFTSDHSHQTFAGADIYIFLTGVFILLIGFSLYQKTRNLPTLLACLTAFWVGLLDSLHFLPEASVALSSFDDRNLVAWLNTLSRLVAMFIIFTGIWLSIPKKWLPRRVAVAFSLVMSVGSISAFILYLQHGLPHQQIPVALTPDGLATQPLILVPACISLVIGIPLMHMIGRNAECFFIRNLWLGFLPYAVSIVYMAFGSVQPYDSFYNLTYLLRWFSYVILVAILAREYLETTFDHGRRQEELFLRQVIDSVPLVIYTVDADNRFSLVNQMTADFFGLSVNETEGRPIADLDREMGQFADFEADNRHILASGESVAVRDFGVVTSQGNEIRCDLTKRLIHHPTDNKPQILGVGLDVTNRWNDRENLRHSEKRFRAVCENAPAGIALEDADGVITEANEAIAELLGFSVRDLIGRSFFDFIHPDDMQSAATNLGRILAGEIASFRADYKLLSRDQSVVVADLAIVALRSASGALIGLASILYDVTESRHAERSLREARDLAESANRAKSDFLANMSHEIRTPMNCILGVSELLMDMGTNSDQQHYLEMINHSGKTLLTLLNDILDVSKIEAKQLHLEYFDCRLDLLCEEVLDMLAFQANSAGLELILDYDRSAPRAINIDPLRLRQVLINLVNNAIKFTDRGHILLKVICEMTGYHEGLFRISISDTGPGLPEDRVDGLFEKFSQAEASTTREFGGSGLGLAICRQLVELMGGTVEAENNPGRGSTFRCLIPMSCLPQQLPAMPAAHELIGNRYAIVTSNPVAAHVAVNIMLHEGLTCDILAPDSASRKICQEAEGSPYDAVLLDEHLVGISPNEIATGLAAACGDKLPRLVLMTAPGRQANDSALARAGFSTHFSKPIVSERLFEALRKAAMKDAPGPAVGATEIFDETEAPTPVEQATPSKGLRVLIAEDNPFNQKVAALMLQKLGYDIEVASDGAQAVDMHARNIFDLILMDCQMPNVDGYEATRRIRALIGPASETPVLAMTANAMAGDRQRCLDAGMNDYLAKPIETRPLEMLLQKWSTKGKGSPQPAR